MLPEVLLKRKRGPSIPDCQSLCAGIGRSVWQNGRKIQCPQTLSSDNIADIVRRVVGAFGNLPSNPSNESGSASSSGSGAGPSYVDTQHELHDRFRIPSNFYSCHPQGVTKGFIKGESLRLLRTNSSKETFEENIKNFESRLKCRGYPTGVIKKYSEVNFSERKTKLKQKNKAARKKILPFVTQYLPALPDLKKTLVGKWHLIQNQPQLKKIFNEPPINSHRKGKSLQDLLVALEFLLRTRESCRPVNIF